MTGLTPYLSFPGTARQALTFYREVFGGDLVLNTLAAFGRRDGPADATAHGILQGLVELPAEASMREFLQERVENLQKAFSGDDAELQATLVVSSILGLTIARHFLRLPAFDTIPRDSLVRSAHAWISTLAGDPSPESHTLRPGRAERLAR